MELPVVREAVEALDEGRTEAAEERAATFLSGRESVCEGRTYKKSKANGDFLNCLSGCARTPSTPKAVQPKVIAKPSIMVKTLSLTAGGIAWIKSNKGVRSVRMNKPT